MENRTELAQFTMFFKCGCFFCNYKHDVKQTIAHFFNAEQFKMYPYNKQYKFEKLFKTFKHIKTWNKILEFINKLFTRKRQTLAEQKK